MAWLGLALLLINAVSPSLAQGLSTPPSATAAVDSSLEDLLQGRLVICTPTGLRVITLDADGQPVTEDQGDAYEGICPFCPPLTSASQQAVPPLLARLVLPRDDTVVILPDALTGVARPRSQARRIPQPRGPPSVI